MKRAKHVLSHTRLGSYNQGLLYPIACMEVLPGDSFRHATAVLLRVSPLVSPVMHPVHLAVHSWFVPNRILWDNWEDFITQVNTTVQTPTVLSGDYPNCKTLLQNMGIGVGTKTDLAVNCLPLRAYNKIWNEFYRDQNLSTPAPEITADTDVSSNYSIRSVSWEKDYFTVARPYAQQGGATAMAATLSGLAPVTGLAMDGTNQGTPTASPVVRETGKYPNQSTWTPGGGHKASPSPASGAGFSHVWVRDHPTQPGWPDVYADMSKAAGSTASIDINEWRRAMAFQRIKEHRNRYGERYRDYLAFLGINSSDARLQRPEYLGGGKQTISFSEVLSTADTTDANIGDFGGHGISAVRTRPYKRFFEEHGWVITVMYVRPKTIYQNQVPRKFLRRTWDQYWQKELEMMGEQEVVNAEVYHDHTTPNGVFGYVPRHDDYRHHESSVSGEFRFTLNYWHMARDFAPTAPALNQSFITCNPTNRIYADTTTDQMYAMIAHKIVARRLVAKNARTG